MSIVIQCPSCSAKYKVDPTLSGRIVTCAKCKSTFAAEEILHEGNIAEGNVADPKAKSLRSGPTSLPAKWLVLCFGTGLILAVISVLAFVGTDDENYQEIPDPETKESQQISEDTEKLIQKIDIMVEESKAWTDRLKAVNKYVTEHDEKYRHLYLLKALEENGFVSDIDLEVGVVSIEKKYWDSLKETHNARTNLVKWIGLALPERLPLRERGQERTIRFRSMETGAILATLQPDSTVTIHQ